LENELFPGRKVSLSTVGRFLNALGYKFTPLKMGMYIDGHKRDDVKEYRIKFLSELIQYEKFIKNIAGMIWKRLKALYCV
jgi:hypothetical protein